MNVVKVYGGLGNQLFQYAFGRAQMENGLDVGFNINWYLRKNNGELRPYILDKFNTKVKLNGFEAQKNILEKYVKYNPNMTNVTSFNFHGYWQDPRYFKHILPILKEEIKVREELYLNKYLSLKEQIINTPNSISVHIRHGDFKGKVNILSLTYYHKAIGLIYNQCGLPDAEKNIFVFSDDILWCKHNFMQSSFAKNVVLSDVEKVYQDFELMRLCKHNIIANSTFSWWAAMLNDNSDKIVIAPKQWRLTEEQQNEMSAEFLHPEGWIIL